MQEKLKLTVKKQYIYQHTGKTMLTLNLPAIHATEVDLREGYKMSDYPIGSITFGLKQIAENKFLKKGQLKVSSDKHHLGFSNGCTVLFKSDENNVEKDPYQTDRIISTDPVWMELCDDWFTPVSDLIFEEQKANERDIMSQEGYTEEEIQEVINAMEKPICGLVPITIKTILSFTYIGDNPRVVEVEEVVQPEELTV